MTATAKNRKPGSSNTRTRLSARQRLMAGLMLHRECAVDALRRLWQQPASSAMTLAVIAIALLLPALLYVTGKNLNQFDDNLTQANLVTVYLQADATDSDVETLQQRLATHEQVSTTRYVSPEQAAADFAEWSGLGDVVDSLAQNPLPASIVIQLSDTRYETAVQAQDMLASQPGVDLVQMDQLWLQRLDSFLSLTQRAVIALIVVLSLAVLFITGNSIRTSIASREAEIRVMNLIGATNGFIARPFLYSGLWYGLLGGALAWLLLALLMMILRGPATELLAYYGSQYQLQGLGARAGAVLLVGSAALGWLGARLSVSRHFTRF
ncbi:permease-like cell division protein FtsX [Pseudohongiella sp.]|uniref:Cell division protein FtsX n=1 Tax=marine sediment metagenome TaxID=412755 RepID=A0A0F9VY07_9ZZZZ|nr:permease-like cell division protein FtsX [Pseudohongiella sp.]HDZ08048.1 FtsX-like permease family protein [Pseudohongiella sp.]HEA64109.1 FtsX-like permease family protein [Pseudohongiella sp.]